MKAKTVTKKKKENDSVIISVNTLQEAKEKIYSDIQNGINYRDIVKTKFDIKGTIKTFNISQINQIKEEFEPKIEEKRLDPDKSKVFKMFQKGLSPTDVIIKTKLSFDFVKKSWQEYAEINHLDLIPDSFLKNLKKIMEPIGWSNRYDGLEMLISETVDSAIESYKFTYNCCGCGKEMPISADTLRDAQKYLSRKWGHSECVTT